MILNYILQRIRDIHLANFLFNLALAQLLVEYKLYSIMCECHIPGSATGRDRDPGQFSIPKLLLNYNFSKLFDQCYKLRILPVILRGVFFSRQTDERRDDHTEPT